MNVSEQQLDHLIAEADPAPNSPDAAVLDQAWTRVAAELDDVATVRFRRRNRVIRVAIGVAAVAALTAAAPFVATRTGVWNTPEWISAGGPGEEYRLNGSDFAQQLATLGTDIPYPDDGSREKVLNNMVANLGGGSEPAEATTGALRADLARGAICAWAKTWQAANTAGDAQQRKAAVDALAGALTWKAVTDVDPHPSIDGDKTAVGNYPTVFGDLPGIIDAARHNQPAKLTDRLENGGSYYCADYDDRVASNDTSAQPPAASDPSARPRGVPTTPPSAAPATKK